MSTYRQTPLPDGTRWPNPLDEWASELEHRLKYPEHHPEAKPREDALVAASILAAYRELVRCPERKRETVVRGLKEAHAAEQRQITIPVGAA